MTYLYYQAINWDRIQDQVDKYTWEKLTNNFWLDIRIPVTDDLNQWKPLSETDQSVITEMIAANSMLAAYQSEIGVPSIRRQRRTQQEECVLNTITFMKSVHAKSATTIFRGLIPDHGSQEFETINANEQLQVIIDQLTRTNHVSLALRKQAAFILAETGLMFGKYLPILKHPELKQTNQIIANILRGSALFTAYVGYKFRLGFKELSSEEQTYLAQWITDNFDELMHIEDSFLATHLDDQAINLAHYGANHACQSLGFAAQFNQNDDQYTTMVQKLMISPEQFTEQVKATNHPVDTEAMTDEDYDF